MVLTPRPYQAEAKAAAYRAIRKNRSALVAMPTGTGKGALIGMIIADAVKARKRVLAMVHRKEIVDQLADHVRRWSGHEPAIERAEMRQADADSLVVVGSVPSLVGRLDRFAPDAFDLLIQDEAHHSLANTWATIRNYFGKVKMLGFTATPNRGDERALAQVFDEVAYDMTIADAILDGWLVPFRTVETKLESLDLTKVRRRSGELMAGDLGAVLSETKVLREAIVPAVEMAGDKQAIAFTVTIAHMHAVAETARAVMQERRMSTVVATVDGTTPRDERDRIFAAFRAREINWLVNVEVATEGFDAPAVEAVIMLRPTLSQALYTQMIGRGGRPLPDLVDGLTVEDMLVRCDQAMAAGNLDPDGWTIRAIQAVHRGDVAAARRLAIALSEKPECLILDFTANTSRHQVASTRDLLGGDYTLPDQAAAQRMLANNSAAHLLDALERAKAQRLAKMREALARAGDPFALFDLSPRADRYGRPPTPKQRRWLDSLHLPRASIDVTQANALLRELSRREDLDLCRYSQAAVLARLGHPVGDIPDLSRAQASMMIRALSADYWQRPSDWQGMRDRAAR